MDENNKESVEELKNQVNERYKALIKINKEAGEKVASIYSDYSTGLFEQDELNKRYDEIASKYKISNASGTDGVLRRENLKDAFFGRVTKAEEYLRRFNELIDKYNKDEIKTKHDLEKRISELNEQYKETLIDLNEEYENVPNKDNEENKQDVVENITSDTSLNVDPLNITDNVSNGNLTNNHTSNTQTENVKFNNSVMMLYGNLKKELETQEGIIAHLNKLVNDSDNLEKKYLKELREAETKRDVIKTKMNNLNLNDSYSKNTNAEDTNVIDKLRNNHMDNLDKKISKIDKQLEKSKENIVYLWGQNGSASDPKKMKNYKKIEKLKKKRATIQRKQKVVVDKQLEKYYKEAKKQISEARTYAKLEYEVLNTYKVQDDLAQKQEEKQELENKKNEVGKIVGMVYAVKEKVNKIEERNLEFKLSKLKDKVGHINNEDLSTEIQQKYGRQI